MNLCVVYDLETKSEHLHTIYNRLFLTKGYALYLQ